LPEKAKRAVAARLRPILLVLSSDARTLSRVRSVLRGAGILSSGGRSFEASLSLLAQVAMDGCVLCEDLTTDQAEELRRQLESVRPGPLCLKLAEARNGALHGWTSCAEEELARTVREGLGMEG
jgi:hypothetical protein